MAADFLCPQCGAQVRGEDEVEEGRAKCPRCEKVLFLPAEGIAPGLVLGGFRIEKVLGTGGMGQVFLVTELATDRVAALKVLPPAMARKPRLVQRFLHEARLIGKLEHPNIVAAFNVGVDAGYCFLAMDFVEGQDLERLVAAEGPLTQDLGLEVATKVSEALRYAWNEHRLLHRDVKPANIMLDRQRNVKLMDLGISKSLLDANEITSAGLFVGTPYYMSPEQAKTPNQIDYRSDMYSLGATLYHVLTGVRPFDGATALAVMAQHLDSPVVPPRERNPTLSEECSQLLCRMMAKQPEERAASWEDLLRDIQNVRNPQVIQTIRVMRMDKRAKAEEHLGTIVVRGDDAPPPGTTTTAVPAPAPPAAAAGASPPAPPGKAAPGFDPLKSVDGLARPLKKFKTRVLIIDDDPGIQKLITAALPRDYVIRSELSSFDAMQCIDVFRPDIILLDINMPGLSGLDFLDLLRSYHQCESARIIVISGYADTQRRVQAYQNGADDFIGKPFSIEELRLKVERWTRFTRFEELSRLQSEFLDLIGKEEVSPFPTLFSALGSLQDVPGVMENEESAQLIRAIITVSEDFVKRYNLLQDFMNCRCETYPLRLEAIPFADIIGPLLPSMLAHAQRRKLTFERPEQWPDPPVMVDARSINRIVRWVMSNSLARARTTIRLASGVLETGDLYLDVGDDGPGFSEKEGAAVFNGFEIGQQLHAGRGMGLHLSLSKELLSLQGGTIHIADRGPGTTRVRLTLPTAAAKKKSS